MTPQANAFRSRAGTNGQGQLLNAQACHPKPLMDTATTDAQTAAMLADPALAAWLTPVSEDDPCGPDLEYDNDFLALTQAATGKAETQFSPAEPPDWPAVRSLAESLNQRSRDLRVARYWLRARLHMDGLVALAPGLRLFEQMMLTWWDELHPRLDDGDAFARLNVLAEFGSADTMLGAVRQSLVLSDRSIGQISVREVEIALGRLSPRDDESPPSRDQIESMLRDAAEGHAEIATQADSALAALDALDECLTTRVGFGERPDYAALRDMLMAVKAVSPCADVDTDTPLAGFEDDSASSSADDDEPAPRRNRSRAGAGGLGSVESRDDAVRAIGLICSYLERTEPSNPAANLLRRAQRLIDRNFLQLVREFAPEAVGEVARVLGMDPDSTDTSFN